VIRHNLMLAMGLCAIVAAADAPESRGPRLDEVPVPVRATIVQLSEGGRVSDVRPQRDRGVTYYDVAIEKGGRMVRYRITSDGAVMGLPAPAAQGGIASAPPEGPAPGTPALVSDPQLARIPPAAREALIHHAAGQAITGLETREIDDEKVYVGSWRAQEKDYRAGVSADGALVMWDESLPAADVPAAVRRAAAKLFRKDAAPEYEQRRMIYYVIRGRDDKKTKEALVSPLGHVEQKPKEVKAPRRS